MHALYNHVKTRPFDTIHPHYIPGSPAAPEKSDRGEFPGNQLTISSSFVF